MLTRLGRFTVRRHRLVLSMTVLFMVAAAVLGTRAFGVLQDDGFADPGSESSRAEAADRRSASPATSRTRSSSSRARPATSTILPWRPRPASWPPPSAPSTTSPR